MAGSKTKRDAPQAVDEEDVVMQESSGTHQPTVEEEEEDGDDDAMVDEAADVGGEVGGQAEDEEEEEEADQPPKIQFHGIPQPTVARFEIPNEGHTLGNVLRYVLMKNPEVEMCAYDIPHPDEPNMLVRIQTVEGTKPAEVLQKGLKDIQDLCDIVTDKFLESRKEFTDQMST